MRFPLKRLNYRESLTYDRTRLWLFGLFALALVLRMIYVQGFHPDRTQFDEGRFWSEIRHVAESWSFTSGREQAHDMPLTAVVFGIYRKLTGCDQLGIRLLNSVFSALLVFPVFNVTRRLANDKNRHVAGLLAATGVVFYPFFVYFSGMILSETLFMLLMVTLIAILLQSRVNIRHAALAGLIAGLAHLTRPTLLWLLPVLMALLFYQKRLGRRQVLRFALCFMLTVSPWIIRNYLVFDTFMISHAGLGQVLWEGNNPNNTTGGVRSSYGNWPLLHIPDEATELERNAIKKQAAFDFIKENPDRYAVLCVKRFFRFWNLWPNFSAFNHGFYKWISLFSFGPVLLFALIRSCRWRQETANLKVLLLLIAYYTAVHAVTLASIRYRIPLDPILIALAGSQLSTLLDV